MAFKIARFPQVVAGLLLLMLLPVPGLPQGPLAVGPPYSQRSRQMTLERSESFLRPATFETTRGETTVTLSVQWAENTLGQDRLKHRSYNGALVGPVIRVQPGDTLRIRLENFLGSTAVGGHSAGMPEACNTTNLHLHGLHVSPVGDGDNIFLDVHPGEHFDYRYHIPRNHPAGTFWYHAHWHGSVALQLASGMAGALLVGGGLDDAPELRNVTQQVMVFQQFVYRRSANGGPAEINADDVYGQRSPDAVSVTTVNGQVTPVIEMRPGEIQRWRLIHAGLDSTIDLNLESHQLHEIAVDGLALGSRKARQVVELQPGYRSDILVHASQQPGTYLLFSEVKDAEHALRKKTVPRTYVAKVVIRGTPVTMSLPSPQSLAQYKPFASVGDAEVVAHRQISLTGAEPDYHINGRPFDPAYVEPQVPLGAVEEWSITSLVGAHPFHVHVNPFEASAPDPETGVLERVWRDTLFVPEGKTVTVRTRFQDFPGPTVMHCHILDHEDKGMMKAFEIVGPGGPLPLPALLGPAHTTGPMLLSTGAPGGNGLAPRRRGPVSPPSRMPDWTLQDPFGHPFRAVDYLGHPLLLVLHRGVGCFHCARQLSQVSERASEFRALGIAVLAVAPGVLTPDEARYAAAQLGISCPLLADPPLRLFRPLRCVDDHDTPLHGTFLIDASGGVRWESVGDSPETNLDELMDAARNMVAAPGNH